MKDVKKDFESFVNAPQAREGSPSVLRKIHSEIAETAPSWKTVAVKLGGIHLASSVVTLAACPQFGLRLFFEGDGLMHYFMKISPTFCDSFCGGFYLSLTFVLARLLLQYDEWLVVLRSRTLTIAALSLLSLGAFAMITHEVSLEAGVFWLFGATLAAEFASASKYSFKRFFQRAN